MINEANNYFLLYKSYWVELFNIYADEKMKKKPCKLIKIYTC